MERIVRVNRFEYRYGGTIQFLDSQTTYKEIDGEIYYKTKNELVQYDLDKSFSKNKKEWIEETHNELSGYGMTIKTWMNTRFTDTYIKKPHEFAFDCGDIPRQRIKNIYYGKKLDGFRTYMEFANYHINEGVFCFPIYGYGWNNFCIIEMPIPYFFSIPFSSHNSHAQSFLEQHYKKFLSVDYFKYNLNRQEKINHLLKIFNDKIKIKQLK